MTGVGVIKKDDSFEEVEDDGEEGGYMRSISWEIEGTRSVD